MKTEVLRRGVFSLLVAVACVAGAAVAIARQALPLEPPKDAGMGITPAFEGWYQNEDGTYTLLVGFFNRNGKETFDIPIGPNNRIEPGGPDMGQPTYFGVRRNWGVFTIAVPKDFGNTKRYIWTIVANGKTASVPVGLIKGYQVEPFKDAAMGNTPPVVKFAENGKEFVGPPRGIAATYTTAVNQPLTLTTWTTDKAGTDDEEGPAGGGRGAGRGGAEPAGRSGAKQAGRGAAEPAGDQAAGRGRGGRGGLTPPPPIRVSWHKFRGPGTVTFAEASPKVDIAGGGKASTTATFSAPGEYILRAQVNDRTGDGGGGFQCCWTNAHVKVTVTGTSTTK
jgi:hypothetical protein